MATVKTDIGNPFNLGATVTEKGVNFALFSRNATSVTLELFNKVDDLKPYDSIPFDPDINRTGDIWHIEVEGLHPGALYLYRVAGPYEPERGFRFDDRALLFDPYAKGFSDGSVIKAFTHSDFSLYPKCVVIDDEAFDWEGDRPLKRHLSDTIVYETHLRGFTISPTAHVSHPGTYLGFIEKIPYLKSLGITAVELLPIHEFDENENGNINPRTGDRLVNYWGYSTIGFFAPKQSYASDRSTPGAAVTEFKELVKALHKAGIEVILDVVYNHTAEGNEHGLTFEFRGLANTIYYILEKDRRYYSNFTGCGNSINANHPVVRELITDSLRYWVTQMHVDGFRFDLASEFSRGHDGSVLFRPPLADLISEDPILRQTKIIAEPWDAAGVYQAGDYPGERWSEWNDHFRDDMRRFFRGDDYAATMAATRFAGSSDMYRRRGPVASINYITCHDGFTMNDLVSYDHKHNEENGENNRDGSDNNLSYNNGYEGICTNPLVEEKRERSMKNMLCGLMISQGVPMLLAGDEFRRTQKGNNNAYCQDSEISWVDWTFTEKYKDMVRFASKLIELRRNHPVFRRQVFFHGGNYAGGVVPDIMWFDELGRVPDWKKMGRFLSFRLNGSSIGRFDCRPDNDFYVAANMDIHDLTIIIPPAGRDKMWVRVVDTSYQSPEDILEPGNEGLLSSQNRYVLLSGSVVILMSTKIDPAV